MLPDLQMYMYTYIFVANNCHGWMEEASIDPLIFLNLSSFHKDSFSAMNFHQNVHYHCLVYQILL